MERDQQYRCPILNNYLSESVTETTVKSTTLVHFVYDP